MLTLILVTGFFLFLLLFFAHRVPAIAIPIGFLLLAQFAWLLAEDYFHGRDNSVGAMFVPLVLLISFVLALIGLFLFLCGMRSLKPKIRGVVLLSLVISVVTGCATVFLWWSYSNIKHVVESAEIIAGNEPYCIDVPSGSDYKEASSLADFSGYQMRAPHSWGWYAGPHAILAVGDESQPKIYHWSYGRKSFVEEVHASYPVYCNPRAHFSRGLREDTRLESNVDRFRFAGIRFAIPHAYRSRVPSSSSYPTLVFSAASPNFEAFPPNTERTELINSLIEVNFVETNRVDVWLTKSSATSKVEDAGEEFGLKKHALWYVPSGKPKPGGASHYQYFNVTSAGRASTLIDCSAGEKESCLHAFQQGGWTYTFHHSQTELPNWKEMQNRLVRLTRSFSDPAPR